MSKKLPGSPILAQVHEMALDFHSAGDMDKTTMREFDELCLTKVEPMSPAQIAKLRRREMASQAVFARYLNVTTGLVSQWERGEKRLGGPSLKLLTLVAKKGLEAIA
jgi:putative transcriptional regulator